MRVKDYIAIVFTIAFVIGLAGCFKFWGCGTFWFYAGLAVTMCAALCQLAET